VSSAISTILAALIKLIQGIAPIWAAYIQGKRSERAEQTSVDADLLRKQRDNDILNADDADSFWMRVRHYENRQ